MTGLMVTGYDLDTELEAQAERQEAARPNARRLRIKLLCQNDPEKLERQFARFADQPDVAEIRSVQLCQDTVSDWQTLLILYVQRGV